VLAYGANACGQLGQSHINSLFAGQFDPASKKQQQQHSHNGSFDPAQHVPIIVKTLLGRHIVRISCGAHHCMALSGACVCATRNYYFSIDIDQFPMSQFEFWDTNRSS
jgi:hypothetical protein